MARKKLLSFEENDGFSSVLQPSPYKLLEAPHPYRGKWSETHFGNLNPLVLELGCGRGEYAVGLALASKDKNFIGVDIKGSRLYHGAKFVEENSLPNICFVRTRIDYIAQIFDNEINEIWLTFPDPRPERKRKRLTSPIFMERYLKILKGHGLLHLKTDSKPLCDYTLEVAQEFGLEVLHHTDDLYSLENRDEICPPIQTAYEKRYLAEGRKINFLTLKVKNNF